ncbi:MAG: SPFH domain-containing protein [Eubacteriales bacterium]
MANNNTTYAYSSRKPSGIGGKKIGILVGIGIAVIAAIILAVNCTTSVPTGYTGIVTTFGKVEDYILDAGLHFKAPWQKVVKMDNRNQKGTVDLMAFSQDIQQVDIRYTVNYQIEKENAQNIYRTIGTGYYDTVMYPRIEEAVKSCVAKYTAEDLLEMRNTLSDEIYGILKEDLSAYNIVIISTSIENIDFSDAFTDAVEAKQVAAQNKLKAEIEQQQAIMEQTAAAERAVIQANAQAETAKIAAEAELEITKIQADAAEYAGQKDAAVNKAIAGSMTDQLLYYYYIRAWDGKLPESYVSSEDFLSIFQIPTGGESSSEGE